MNKQQLRERHLQLRRSMPAEVREAYSRRISERLLGMPEFLAADCVASYIPIRSEVDTGKVNHAAVVAGKRLALPVCMPDGNMVFAQAGSLEELVPDAMGMMAPSEHARQLSIEEIALFIVPGVVFDLFGNRIGYGKGYYDRVMQSRSLALAFECQITGEIPTEPHDKPVGAIITEERIIIPLSK